MANQTRLALALLAAGLTGTILIATLASSSGGERTILTPLQRFEGPVLTRGEVQAVLLRTGWPSGVTAEAAEVAHCESEWDITMTGDLGEYGLFQIHPVHYWRFDEEFGSAADPYDPVQNAEIALDIWEEESWEPWACAP
jgi:hypothetical protein